MKIKLFDCNGNIFSVESPISYQLRRTDGTSLDGFEICFIADKNKTELLKSCVKISCEHENKTVFTGIIDEYSVDYKSGILVTVSGRGMGAILADNEAEAAEFSFVSVEDVLKRYVYPLGVENVRYDAMPKLYSFSVSSGKSVYSVISDFAYSAKGIVPRFDGGGELILSEAKGKTLTVDDKSCPFEMEYSNKRYGVVSRVTVKNARGKKETVNNTVFQNEGGNSSRVVMTTLSKTSADMVKIGERIISESMADRSRLTLSLPYLFAAEPNDICRVSLKSTGISGTFYVYEALTWASSNSYGTKLYMREVL